MAMTVPTSPLYTPYLCLPRRWSFGEQDAVADVDASLVGDAVSLSAMSSHFRIGVGRVNSVLLANGVACSAARWCW